MSKLASISLDLDALVAEESTSAEGVLKVLSDSTNELSKAAAASISAPLASLARELSDYYMSSIRKAIDLMISSYTHPLIQALKSYENHYVYLSPTPLMRLPASSSTTKPELDTDHIGLLMVTQDGGFKYREEWLYGLSIDNAHGRLLKLLLESRDRFARDAEIYESAKVGDGRDLSFVIRNLKTALLREGFRATIKRRRTSPGYLLLSIERIS